MGMFDSVHAPCPRCERVAEFQSKSGPCSLDRFTLVDAPWQVLADTGGVLCEGCGTAFALSPSLRTADACAQCGHVDRLASSGRTGAIVRILETARLETWDATAGAWSPVFEGPIEACAGKLEALQPTSWRLLSDTTDVYFVPRYQREAQALALARRKADAAAEAALRRETLLAKGIDEAAILASELEREPNEPPSPATGEQGLGARFWDTSESRARDRTRARISRLEAVHAIEAGLSLAPRYPGPISNFVPRPGQTAESLAAVFEDTAIEVFVHLLGPVSWRCSRDTSEADRRWPGSQVTQMNFLEFLQIQVPATPSESPQGWESVPAWSRMADLEVELGGWLSLDGVPIARFPILR